MTKSLRNDFHADLAQTISNEIQYKRSNYYYFLGKIEPWADTDLTPAVQQNDSEFENHLIRSNAVFMKKVTPNDVSLVTKRYDWTSGQVFSIYDNTKNLKDVKFYCLTDDNNVYKCLDNAAKASSTVKPTGKSFYVIRTSDGYLWKYMYTVPSFKRTRFLSLTSLPVQRSLTDRFYNKGSVDAVSIASFGSGYVDVLLTTIIVSGTTTGSGGTGTITCGSTGNITGVIITSGGTAYTKGVNVDFVSGTGVGGRGTAVITGGVITGVTITSAGVGYSTGNTISFTVGGAEIIPSVSRVTGSIQSINIKKSGAGYVSNPVLTVNGTPGTGKYGNATALVSSVVFEGKIVRVNIQDPGINYPTDNNTSIVVRGNGIDAKFSPVVFNGEVVDVIIENAGTGYTTIDLTVVGTGTGAVVNPIISASDFSSEQSIVEQTTTLGAIYSVVVQNGGTGYTSSTLVTVVGDGVGCTVTPVITAGVIVNIIVNNYGSNYTYAKLNIVDANRTGINQTNATAYTVLSPINGHGFDAVKELFGDTVAINSSLRQDANLIKIYQDYRQFGIIKNPNAILSGKLLTDDSTLLVYTTRFESTVGLMLDEILVQDSIKFRVVDIDGLTVYLQQLGASYKNLIGTMTSDINSSRTYTINTVVQYPVANKYTGSLLYVSNENPFSFTADQSIVIKTFLKF